MGGPFDTPEECNSSCQCSSTTEGSSSTEAPSSSSSESSSSSSESSSSSSESSSSSSESSSSSSESSSSSSESSSSSSESSSSSSSSEIYWCAREKSSSTTVGSSSTACNDCPGWVNFDGVCKYVNKGDPRPNGSTVYLNKSDCDCIELGANCGPNLLGQLAAASDCGLVCIKDSEFDQNKYEKVSGPYYSKEECEVNCCGSSSSSSSCEPCQQFKVTLTTSGCCLYMGPNGIEAVGAGKVTASGTPPSFKECTVVVLLNGSTNETTDVQDGDSITVEAYPQGSCSCCETKRNCNAKTQSLWLQKSNKENKAIVLNKKTLMDKVKFAAQRVSKKSRKLR